jgi:hypothetical protein
MRESLPREPSRKRAGLELQQRATQLDHGALTFSAQICAENGWEYPCYVARGRVDDGSYVSVEPSDQYAGMRPGYFVVIVASGNLADVLVSQRALRARHITTYVKNVPIWEGCIH